MGILTLSEEHQRRLRRFRRNTWIAIALCAVFRVADSAFGLGLAGSAPSFAAQDIAACPLELEFHS